jgi:hypothetical protein
MKKIISLSVLVLSIVAYGYGQQNVRGGDFEHWRHVVYKTYNYYEPDSSMFSTLDTLNYAPTPPNGISAYRCDTAYSGNYSARLVTRTIAILTVIIPGVIGTIKTNWAEEKAILGTPYPYGTTLPIRFSGYYQSYPISNDSSAAVVLLSKWNSSIHSRDTLAYTRLVFHGTIDSWTAFDTAITYRDQSTIPDSLTILLLSCGGFNASQMFGSKGQIGSMAMFDDVSLTGVNGFPLLLMPSVSVKLSPNPASQYMKIETGRSIENGYFEVYDAQAKLIRQIQMSGNNKQIEVSELSSGTYYYKLIENSKLLNSGTFIITR